MTIRTLRSDVELAMGLHRRLEAEIAAWQDPYIVRRDTRWVTSRRAGGPLVYVRTDYSRATGSFFTTIVAEASPGDRALYKVVVGSIEDAGAASLASPGGTVDRTLAALEVAPTPVDPSTIPPANEAAEAEPSSGTAFYVNSNALLTAGHVIDGCTRVEMIDGSPLRLMARHSTRDLALLTTAVPSGSWIAIGEVVEAELGQRIAALGYPYFGQLGTALNMTAGNVSALSGIADDPDILTISAPIQPGNSGGPLLANDGTLLGVVVAKLDGLEVAQATGSLPENINYAVSGPALLAFLREQGVSLSPHDGAELDIELGIPEAMQQAVVPVICRRA